MGEVVDGEYQKYTVSPGQYIREHFFGKYPELAEMVATYSDEKLKKMRRGGHDPEKVFAAYKAAVETKGRPTVILAKTIKGYGLGEAGEGRNITHQLKKANEDELREFRSRFGIPISDEDSRQGAVLQAAGRQRGDAVPARAPRSARRRAFPRASRWRRRWKCPRWPITKKVSKATATRSFPRRWASCGCFSKLLRDKRIGKYLVPIVPDESRTFGMEGLFRQVGIYAHAGQLYEPVDSDVIASYREAEDGQILEEGITEAGSMSSFIAAGSAYASHGIHMIPFFIYYSMFGFQRIGDLIWAACDQRVRGFMLGATAGRTTLAGEGLQHQDGQSHLIAMRLSRA